jgi:hypothetical protein
MRSHPGESMKPAALAGLFCAALVCVGVGGYLAVADSDRPIATGSIKSTVPIASSDPRNDMNVVKVDWRREGFGLTSVADVSVRNSNDYAVRLDRISCRFRTKSGATEEHTQGVYGVIQPRTEKLIRDVSLGFVDSDAKGIDCSVVGARRDL